MSDSRPEEPIWSSNSEPGKLHSVQCTFPEFVCILLWWFKLPSCKHLPSFRLCPLRRPSRWVFCSRFFVPALCVCSSTGWLSKRGAPWVLDDYSLGYVLTYTLLYRVCTHRAHDSSASRIESKENLVPERVRVPTVSEPAGDLALKRPICFKLAFIPKHSELLLADALHLESKFWSPRKSEFATFWLSCSCPLVTFRLPLVCLSLAFRLPLVCLSVAFRLPLRLVSTWDSSPKS